jgi:hypothetical protein
MKRAGNSDSFGQIPEVFQGHGYKKQYQKRNSFQMPYQ